MFLSESDEVLAKDKCWSSTSPGSCGRPERLPVVLTREEVRAVIQRLEGVPRLMAYLLYGGAADA
jgi:hypothetical protein